jgi:hypothetical protein
MKTITITMTIDVAETLHGLLDGCIGTSGDDSFTSEMKPVIKSLESKIKKARKK